MHVCVLIGWCVGPITCLNIGPCFPLRFIGAAAIPLVVGFARGVSVTGPLMCCAFFTNEDMFLSDYLLFAPTVLIGTDSLADRAYWPVFRLLDTVQHRILRFFCRTQTPSVQLPYLRYGCYACIRLSGVLYDPMSRCARCAHVVCSLPLMWDYLMA